MSLLNNPDGRHRSIMNDEQILKYLQDILRENFEIEADRVTLDANLFDDLDLDLVPLS